MLNTVDLSPAIRRSSIAFAFRKTSRPDCIGTTRTFTDSAKRRCSAEHPARIIVEGIERANKEVAGLPERVLIIRDQDLLNPNAPPSKSEPVVPKDADRSRRRCRQ